MWCLLHALCSLLLKNSTWNGNVLAWLQFLVRSLDKSAEQSVQERRRASLDALDHAKVSRVKGLQKKKGQRFVTCARRSLAIMATRLAAEPWQWRGILLHEIAHMLTICVFMIVCVGTQQSYLLAEERVTDLCLTSGTAPGLANEDERTGRRD